VVDCDDIQRRVLEGADLRESAAAEHLRSCEACAAMVAAAPALGGAGSSPSAMPSWSALEAAIASDEAGVGAMRSWSTPMRRATGAALVLAVPVLVLLRAPRPDLAVYPLLRWLLECTALFVVIGWASMIALRPMHRADVGFGGRWVAILGVVVAVVLASLPAIDSGSALHGIDALARAPGCLLFGTLCAVPTWIGLRLLARDGDRLGARAGVVAAASAGVGLLAVYLHCPIPTHGHLWAGHVTVLLLPWLWALRVRRR